MLGKQEIKDKITVLNRLSTTERTRRTIAFVPICSFELMFAVMALDGGKHYCYEGLTRLC